MYKIFFCFWFSYGSEMVVVVVVVVVAVVVVVVDVVVAAIVEVVVLLLIQSWHVIGHVYSEPVGHPMSAHSFASTAIEQSTFWHVKPENPFGWSHWHLHAATSNLCP